MQIGGRYSKYEKEMSSKIAPLEKQLERISATITNTLITAYNRPLSSKAYWKSVESSIHEQFIKMKLAHAKWIKRELPGFYIFSIKDITSRLNRSKEIAKLQQTPLSVRVARVRKIQATVPKEVTYLEILTEDAVSDFNSAADAGEQEILRYTRKTQQTLVQEGLVDASVKEALESGNLLNATIPLPDTFAGQLYALSEIIDNERYVKAGTRKFRATYYAEMVARTKFHEAQAYASIATAKNYETSLVQVSAHNTTTEVCMGYEGKVYSINGEDPRFPRLLDYPPFHQNCLHLLFPMFVSGMEAQGTLDGWIAFSNGKAEKPPTPSAFIPIKQRTA